MSLAGGRGQRKHLTQATPRQMCISTTVQEKGIRGRRESKRSSTADTSTVWTSGSPQAKVGHTSARALKSRSGHQKSLWSSVLTPSCPPARDGHHTTPAAPPSTIRDRQSGRGNRQMAPMITGRNWQPVHLGSLKDGMCQPCRASLGSTPTYDQMSYLAEKLDARQRDLPARSMSPARASVDTRQERSQMTVCLPARTRSSKELRNQPRPRSDGLTYGTSIFA